jgi:hypothetical protein
MSKKITKKRKWKNNFLSKFKIEITVSSREEYELKKLQVRKKGIKVFGAKIKYLKL